MSLVLGLLLTIPAEAQNRTESVEIRGHDLKLLLYGNPEGEPIVMSSGDGGWVHLAPDVAKFLSSRGFFVIGFDSKAYLESFTDGKKTLSQEDIPVDYRVLIDFASKSARARPILIGVSEGAGLSVLAATVPANQERLGGVIGLGLPNVNELGWRFRDSIIYITKSVPDEPTFTVDSVIAKVSPLPLVAIQSTHDEFVPLSQLHKMMEQAGEPKKLWIIDAPNHRFSGQEDELDRKLLEAIEWIRDNQPQPPSSPRDGGGSGHSAHS